jgi:pyruvate-formate lyase-activating enzyme
MCECGCVGNDERYLFPGPGKTLYILSLSGCCLNCYSPSGFTIERVDSTNVLWKEFNRGEFLTGNLKFEKWPDSVGVAIITGMVRHEFVDATKSHLIGIDPKDFADNDGLIDGIGAETILEEMYKDAQKRPQLVESTNNSGGEKTAKS